jgi:hypothetical protein
MDILHINSGLHWQVYGKWQAFVSFRYILDTDTLVMLERSARFHHSR